LTGGVFDIIKPMAQKVIKIGSSSGVTIPRAVLIKLGLKVGDVVDVRLNDKSGSIEVSSAKSEKLASELIWAKDVIQSNIGELSKVEAD
jgi:antitoxin component of MazEF toxin-antitoxin module